MDEAGKTTVKRNAAIELVAAALACMVFAYIATCVHLIMVDKPAATDISFWHESVLAGEATSPNQYRPGAYLMAEWIKSAFFEEIYSAYFYQRLIFTFLTGFFSFIFFRRFLPVGWSFGALGWFFAIIPFTYLGYGHQPADPVNAAFYVLAYIAMASGTPSWVILITPIGVFFRETALLIPLFSLMIDFDQPPIWGKLTRFIIGILAGLIVYAAIRYVYGQAEHPDPWIMIAHNFMERKIWFRFALVLLALPTGLAIWCWKGLDKFLKRSLLFVLLFLIIHFVFGRFGETRLFLPILPLLIVSALYGLKWRLEG